MNAIERIAKEITTIIINQYEVNPYHALETGKLTATSLLAMKQDCPECGGVGTHTWNATKYDYPATTCSRCNGTGKSDLPVIAEVCPDQTLPRYNHPSGEACYAVATAQQDMITPYEENGRVVKWVKCYVD